jgi:PAS domain S-box-containing protein
LSRKIFFSSPKFGVKGFKGIGRLTNYTNRFNLGAIPSYPKAVKTGKMIVAEQRQRMVRKSETSAAERWLDRATAWIPARLRASVISLFALAVVTLAAYPFLHSLPRGSRGTPVGLVFSFLYLLVLLGSSWLGYLSGILTWASLIFILSAILNRSQRVRAVDFEFVVRLGLVFVVSLLISALGANRRRREAELVSAADDLERRVEERTLEVTTAAREARQHANSLREQAQLLDLAHDGILSLDWDGTIRFWNRGAERMYGWTAHEAVGKISYELLKTEFPEPLASIEDKVATTGYWDGELGHTRKDGTKLCVASRWAARRESPENLTGFLEINTDITERRNIEEQLRHTAKLESLGVLAGGVAHDFNNLLTGILGNSSLAMDHLAPNHPSRELLEEVMHAAERAADLTRQLLAYAGKGRFVMRTLDLSDLVREIVGLVHATIPKQAQLRVQVADNLPGIDADPGQLQQIVMNLVINGAEAIGSEGGSVLVRTGVQDVDAHYISTMSSAGELLKPGQYVTLEVHDTGAGMDEATLAKIFDPFFTTKFAGRGLGLSAVLGIVRAHQGALKVYSRPGQGTTFKVLFRASANHVVRAPQPEKRELSGVGTVLVVDDEEVVRITAKHTLERYGYRTMLANDGADALATYRDQPGKIHLVLLDLTMPIMNGEETLRHLQAVNPKVRVLLSSGYNEIEAVQRFAGKGLAGFIQKPYTAAGLAEKVKEALVG